MPSTEPVAIQYCETCGQAYSDDSYIYCACCGEPLLPVADDHVSPETESDDSPGVGDIATVVASWAGILLITLMPS